MAAPDVDMVESRFREVQDYICDFLKKEAGGQRLFVDPWDYHKGKGGGRTCVFEAGRGYEQRDPATGEYTLHVTTHPLPLWEKGACNFSGIEGDSMPPTAVEALKIPAHTSFRATGVSLIIHPSNPWVPTVHLNIRFFACGDMWWFGGGIDITEYYPRLQQVVAFHETLRALCRRHNMDYDEMKKRCDEYFFLSHRSETRGVGGIFYDRINDDFERNMAFTIELGRSFVELYSIFTKNKHFSFTKAMREFQLYRRGRYVEFNLITDRGTRWVTKDGGTRACTVGLSSDIEERGGGT
jgi:coproporphyrinogen III oxidase